MRRYETFEVTIGLREGGRLMDKARARAKGYTMDLVGSLRRIGTIPTYKSDISVT